MEICSSCRKRKATVLFGYAKPVCSVCFFRVFEKRCRNDLTYSKAIDEIIGSSCLLVSDDNTFEAEAALMFLYRIITDKRVRIIPVKGFSYANAETLCKKNRARCVALPWSIEKEDNLFLENELLEKKNVPIGPSFRKGKIIFIKIFRNATLAEINKYAKMKAKRKKHFKMKGAFSGMIEGMEKKYPGIKFSLLSSAGEGLSHPEKLRKSQGKL